MTDRSRWRIVYLSVVLTLAACGSSQPATLYSGGGGSGPACAQPALLDGEIRMTTHWTAAADETPDVRVVSCDQGRLSCWFQGPGGRREGFVRECDWNALWARLEPVSPWASPPPTVKAQDPTGGPYHVVQLRAGTQVSQFSSQHRADILVFTSREAADRLQYSNAIVDFVGARARTLVQAPPPAESRPTHP